MKRTLSIAALTLLNSGLANAQFSVPNTFTAGSIIRATDVNANFTAIAGEVNSKLTNTAGTVTSAQISDGSIMNADIASGASISWSKINKSSAIASEVGAVAISEVGSSPNQIVRLDGIARLPAVDGSLLVNLPLSPWNSMISGDKYLGLNTSAISTTLVNIQGHLTGTSGNEVGLFVKPNIQQTSTAGYTALMVDTITSTTGSGPKKLMDLKFNGTSKMVVDTAGNVGIGTTTPAQALDVNGIVQTTANGYGFMHTGTNSVSIATYVGSGYGVFGTESNHKLALQVNQVEKMTLLPNGYVGIGTAAPAYTLDVAGNIFASGTITPSDRRLKKNIQSLSHALENLEEIRGVSYEWKKLEKGRTAGRQIGLIAQEVEKVFPEAVATDAKGMKAVSYSLLVAPLINAVKELHAKHQVLENENRAMKEYLCAKDESAPFCI